MDRGTTEADLIWVQAAALEDIWEGDLLEVNLNGESVIIVHPEGGKIKAFQGICPHQEKSLADGYLEGNLLVCAGHRWEFDVSSGKGINPMGCELFEYLVRVEGDLLFVGYPRKAGRRNFRFTATLAGE